MGHFKLIGPGTDGLYKYGGATIELSSLGTRRWYVTIRFKNQEVDLDEYRSSNEALEAAMAWVDAAPEHPRDFHGRPRPLGEMRYPKLEPPEPHFVSPRESSDTIQIAPDVEVRRMGPIERGARYRHVDGWAVFVDGREQQPWMPKREAVAVAKDIVARGLPNVRETSHRVADFNTLDDLLAHARQEGATHYLQIDDETHIYFQRRDGAYEKAEAWQKDGYWHTQAPGSRAVVRKPPPGAKAIGGGRGESVESPRRSAHHHPGRRK